MKILFDRVSHLCELNNIKPRDLEIQCGLSRNAIDKWEKESGSAYVESIMKVARHFDVSIDYLVGNSDNPQSHKNPIVYKEILNEKLNMELDKLTILTASASSEIGEIKQLLYSSGILPLDQNKDNI